jgi:hypothetical protein
LAKGATNVYEKKSSTAVDSVKITGMEEPKSLYPSNSYQKVLDYHVAEILLTIVFGIVVLLRLHH